MSLQPGAFSDNTNLSVAKEVAKIMETTRRNAALPDQLIPYVVESKQAIQTLRLMTPTDIHEVAEVALKLASEELGVEFDAQTIKSFKNALGV